MVNPEWAHKHVREIKDIIYRDGRGALGPLRPYAARALVRVANCAAQPLL